MKTPEFRPTVKSAKGQEKFRKKLLKSYDLPKRTTDSELLGHIDIKDRSVDDAELNSFLDSTKRYGEGIFTYPKMPMEFLDFVRLHGIMIAELNLDGSLIHLQRRDVDKLCKIYKKRLVDMKVSSEVKDALKESIEILLEVLQKWPKVKELPPDPEDERVKKLVESGKSINMPSNQEFRELTDAVETEQLINERVNPKVKERGIEDEE